MGRIEILRAGPLTTIQDAGRSGMLSFGISASGPMCRADFRQAGRLIDGHAGAAIEFSSVGITLSYRGPGCTAAVAGGQFIVTVKGEKQAWPRAVGLRDGDVLDIRTGPAGNFGYLRFNQEIDVPVVLESRATNATVGLGGLEGRALRAGDNFDLVPIEYPKQEPETAIQERKDPDESIRVIWGIHAHVFSPSVRNRFCESSFSISSQMNRMGMRLLDTHQVFAGDNILSLVSDAIVPGDIQILGDGSPIVLLRDHQPTGGYPRIATIINADLDRFSQVRPGTNVHFRPVTVVAAHKAMGLG